MTVTPAVGRLALPRRVDARAIGVALVVASACGYGSGPIFAKPAYAAGVDWMTLLFWRFTIAAALSWAWLLLVPGNRASFRLLTRRRALIMLALGVFFVGNSATYYAGLETVPRRSRRSSSSSIRRWWRSCPCGSGGGCGDDGRGPRSAWRWWA